MNRLERSQEFIDWPVGQDGILRGVGNPAVRAHVEYCSRTERVQPVTVRVESSESGPS